MRPGVDRPSRRMGVLLNSRSEFFNEYVRRVQPYLDHFGFPYIEIDIGAPPDPGTVVGHGVYLVGHASLLAGIGDAGFMHLIAGEVVKGAGLICFDPTLMTWSGVFADVIVPARRLSVASRHFLIVDNSHYITALHEPRERIDLLEPVEIRAGAHLQHGSVLVSTGDASILEVGAVGGGKVVLWNDASWMSHAVRGPIAGMDDLVWRGIVWVSRKPCVLQGMPPFVTMRVDDVWGSGGSGLGGDPFHWVGACNRCGLKPWLGLFLDNMSDQAIDNLRRYTRSGGATAFPHAFNGNECQVDPTKPERWIYYDHHKRTDFPDPVMRANVNRVRRWHRKHGIEISAMAIGHYYEIGRNALPHLLEMGCEFIGTPIAPGAPYTDDEPWLRGGPFRSSGTGPARTSMPMYYAHPLEVETMPAISRRLFNCLVEIRDVCGYEWAPDNDVERTIHNGVLQLRRSLGSLIPATLFTHESDYLQHIAPANWERILRGVVEGIASSQPQLVTLEHACRYVRARAGVRIPDAVMLTDGTVSIDVEGRNDMPTTCTVIRESPSGVISWRSADIPRVDGRERVERSC